MSHSSNLYRLQQIDSQLDQTHQRLKSIAITLKNDTVLQQAEKQERAAKERLHKAQHELREAEDTVRSQQIKIEQTENTLYSGTVRNPKELQDLQNETAALKRYLSVLEDRQLDAMLSVEEAEESHQKVAENLKVVIAHRSETHASLKGEQTRLQVDEKRLETEKQAALRSVPENELSIYERLRQQRGGTAVAKVSQNGCDACGSSLNTAVVQAAASNLLAYCPTCGRILFRG